MFIDGFYWHGCPDHCRIPASNNDSWTGKVDRDMERDRLDAVSLADAGWRVLRLWEHMPVDEAVERVASERAVDSERFR